MCDPSLTMRRSSCLCEFNMAFGLPVTAVLVVDCASIGSGDLRSASRTSLLVDRGATCLCKLC